MRKFIAPILISGMLVVGGCAQVKTVCTDLAAMPPAAAAALDAQDLHSAGGILWADTKAACTNGVPTLGVDQSWGSMVWDELKALIPQVLPSLLPLLIGILP